MTGLTARAPAKLNLQLSVGPRRPDGFHELATIFHAVSLFDEVTVRPAARITVQVEGEGASDVPAGRDNLATQAAISLRRATGISGGARIAIRKRIPVAAGLAGGSADAAAALVACNTLWQTGLSHADLADLAAGLGSDVPFSLAGGTAVGLGRGERLTPALVSGRYHWVLAVAGDGLPTAAVYAEYDRLRATPAAGDGYAGGDGRSRSAARQSRPPARGASQPPASGVTQPPTSGVSHSPASGVSRDLLAALRSGDATEVGALLSNDLEPAALSLRPELRQALQAGRDHGALGSIVSGSGPTCAFLARGREHAIDLAAALAGAGVCRYVTSVHGPVPGAIITTPAGRLSTS